ncbi:MAG TPA: TIGR00300 family protein, partial [Actinomycetota bacterium]|nr:TIGR00300 family protein [Actinomycetota bacterium]
MPSEHVTLEGHIIDSLILPKVLDEVIELGASFEIVDLQIGVKHEDPSFARIKVTAGAEGELNRVIDRLRRHGANPETVADANVVAADVEGAFPAGFYSTTNLETEVRLEGHWLRVEHPEMDCGIVVEDGRARTIPMGDVHA